MADDHEPDDTPLRGIPKHILLSLLRRMSLLSMVKLNYTGVFLSEFIKRHEKFLGKEVTVILSEVPSLADYWDPDDEASFADLRILSKIPFTIKSIEVDSSLAHAPEKMMEFSRAVSECLTRVRDSNIPNARIFLDSVSWSGDVPAGEIINGCLVPVSLLRGIRRVGDINGRLLFQNEISDWWDSIVDPQEHDTAFNEGKTCWTVLSSFANVALLWQDHAVFMLRHLLIEWSHGANFGRCKYVSVYLKDGADRNHVNEVLEGINHGNATEAWVAEDEETNLNWLRRRSASHSCCPLHKHNETSYRVKLYTIEGADGRTGTVALSSREDICGAYFALVVDSAETNDYFSEMPSDDDEE